MTERAEYLPVFLMARQDLSHRLGVSSDSISLARVEKVEWPDTSLGNPQPGGLYAQMLVPGFKLTLEAHGQSYLYHTSQDRVVLAGQG